MTDQVKSSQIILVVEDNDDDFETTEIALRDANLINPIIRCIDGQKALDYLFKSGEYENNPDPKPGIILLDLNMPGLDGRQVLKEIKSNENVKEIPVIVLTTSNDERDIGDCYKAGANTYVQKPVDLDRFIEAIQRLKEYWLEIAVLPKA